MIKVQAGDTPTLLCDVTVCEQQQGKRMNDRRVSDENVPVGFDSAEKGQPATRKLFLSSSAQKKDNIRLDVDHHSKHLLWVHFGTCPNLLTEER